MNKYVNKAVTWVSEASKIVCIIKKAKLTSLFKNSHHFLKGFFNSLFQHLSLAR